MITLVLVSRHSIENRSNSVIIRLFSLDFYEVIVDEAESHLELDIDEQIKNSETKIKKYKFTLQEPHWISTTLKC